MGNNSCCSSTGSNSDAGVGWLTRVALDFFVFFFFLPPMQAAKPPPQSASKQQRARIPSKIQSHKRLLDEFSVVVVTAVLCAPWDVAGPGAAVVLLPMAAAPMAPAITPPATSPPRIFPFLPGPGGEGPGAAVVSQGLVA